MCLHPIILRSDREMQPIRSLLRTLNEQFIKLLPRQIGIVSQNHPISHDLNRIRYLNIHSAPEKMIGIWRTADFPVHRF